MRIVICKDGGDLGSNYFASIFATSNVNVKSVNVPEDRIRSYVDVEPGSGWSEDDVCFIQWHRGWESERVTDRKILFGSQKNDAKNPLIFADSRGVLAVPSSAAQWGFLFPLLHRQSPKWYPSYDALYLTHYMGDEQKVQVVATFGERLRYQHGELARFDSIQEALNQVEIPRKYLADPDLLANLNLFAFRRKTDRFDRDFMVPEPLLIQSLAQVLFAWRSLAI